MSVDKQLARLRGMLAAFDALKSERNGIHDKHLSLAMGVAAPQVKRWRKLVEKIKPTRGPNQDTQNAITSLGDPTSLWGLEVAIREMEATVQDLKMAVLVRRALATPTGEVEAAIGAVGQTDTMAETSDRHEEEREEDV